MHSLEELIAGAAQDTKQASDFYLLGQLDDAQQYLLKALYKNQLIKKIRRSLRGGRRVIEGFC